MMCDFLATAALFCDVTHRSSLLVPSDLRPLFLDFLDPEEETETSVTDYQSTLRKIPKKRSSYNILHQKAVAQDAL